MQKICFLAGIPRVKSFGTWFDSSPVSTHPAAPRLHGPAWLPMSHSEVHWWGFGQLWFAALPIVPHPRLCSLYWPKLIKLHMKATAEPLTSTMRLFLGTSYSTCVWSCILHRGLSSSPQGCSYPDKCNLKWCVCGCVDIYISVDFCSACWACMQNWTHKGLHIAIFEACNYVACIVGLLPLILVFSKAKPRNF